MLAPFTIIIASVLKPVKDTRTYQKIARSIAQAFPSATLHLIGFSSSNMASCSPKENIIFHPIFSFNRLSIKRFASNFYFFRKLLQIKPKILIISTFELLPAAILYKIFFKTTLVYDMQENYYLNIRFTKVFPSFLRVPIAYVIRLVEYIAHPFVAQYWLAEQCYAEEMPYLQKKSILLENKFQGKAVQSFAKPAHIKKFLYTGTISWDYGIERAIRFIEQYHTLDSESSLTIVGHCPKDLDKIFDRVREIKYIHWQGSATPIPHETIIEFMKKADVVLLPYQINPSVAKRIPTKLFECWALKKIMLIQENEEWKTFLQTLPTESAIFIDFDKLKNLQDIAQTFHNTPFYQQPIPQLFFGWENEVQKMIDSIQQILIDMPFKK